jgi:hypothetical protein
MLDYQTQDRRYQPTREDHLWRLRRLAYYGAQLLLFLAIIYGVGPNLFLFHSLFRPSPASYARLTPPYVSIVAAIKAYQRDTGSLPSGTYELPKRYLPADCDRITGEILGHPDVTFQVGNTVLAYDFTPATEGWIIYAPRYQGRIPAPLVQAAPSPTTRVSSSATQRSSDAD